jgi:hypothetical protein
MEPVAITLIIFLSVTLIVGTFLLTRHRERIQMIEKGMTAEEIRGMIQFGGFKPNPLSSLKWGMVFIGVGLAAVIGMWLHSAFMVDEGVIPGLIAVFGGIGLVVFYFIADRKARSAAK